MISGLKINNSLFKSKNLANLRATEQEYLKAKKDSEQQQGSQQALQTLEYDVFLYSAFHQYTKLIPLTLLCFNILLKIRHQSQ